MTPDASIALPDLARGLLDETTELVCAAGPGGRIVYVNRAWQRALGYSFDEAATMQPIDLVAPEHRGWYLDVARRLVRGEPVEEFEAVLLAKDGHRVVCRGRATPRMEGGRCVGTVSVYRDVTSERQSETLRTRLAATLEATSDFVGIATRDGGVVYLNRAWRRLLGLLENADLSAVRVGDLYPASTLERLISDAVPVALKAGRWEGDALALSAAGEQVPVSMVIVAHPSLRPDDAPYFYSAVMRDLRDRVRAEEALRESEERYRDLLAALPLVVYRVAPEPPYAPVYVSPGVATLGWTYEQWMATPDTWVRAIHPDDRERVRHETEAALAAGRPVEYEYRLIAPDGTVRWVHDRGEFLHGPDGRPTAWQGIMLDVTARRAAEEALRESEARFRGVLEHLRAVAVTVDREARLVFANDQFLAVTGWSREKVLGRDWFEHFSARGEGARGQFEAMLARGEVAPHYETELLLRSGAVRLIEWDVVVQRAADGRIERISSVGRDVTEERQTREIKDQLIATVSHELRSPLGAIHGALRLLAKQATMREGQPRALVEMALRNADRLIRLTNDLLDVERLDSGTAPMNPVVVSSEALIQSALETMRHVADEAGVRLEQPPRGDAPASHVRADVDRVMQVLLNLIGNAIKFSPRGSAVAVDATPGRGEVCFRVRDQGRGIPADKLATIFDRFAQVRASDARDLRGAGLGLAISRSIVRQHGGRIWAESEEGIGSTFTFTLPAAMSSDVAGPNK